jgi:hypothetical protein
MIAMVILIVMVMGDDVRKKGTVKKHWDRTPAGFQ